MHALRRNRTEPQAATTPPPEFCKDASSAREAHPRSYLERLVARVSPTNRPCLESYLKAKRSAGLKTATLEQSAYLLGLVDQLTPGRPFLELKPDDLRDVLDALASKRAPATAYVYAAILKAFYAWAHPDGIPPAIRRALKRKTPELVAQEPVITMPEFRALLEACETRHGPEMQYASRAHCCEMQALLWVLWDTGFRISEALALRIGDFRPAADGGAHLPLPKQEDTPLPLKTGQRAMATFVIDCVPAITTWLPFHPLKDDLTAPLFPSQRDARRAIPDPTLARFFEKLGKRAGVTRVHPHLFRHTRATRAAEGGWNEAQLCAYFGWKRGSRMASHYVHISQLNLENRVREQAQADPVGALIREDPKAAMAQITRDAVLAALEATGHVPPRVQPKTEFERR